MATANVRSPKSKYGDDRFFVSMKGIGKGTYTVTAAKAIEYVYNWGWKPTAPFSWNVNNWIERGTDAKFLPEQMQQYVTNWVDKMRENCRTVAEHPIKRQQRLKEYRSITPLVSLSDEEISTLYELIGQK